MVRGTVFVDQKWSGWDQFCLQKWSYPYKFGPPRTKNVETKLVRGTIFVDQKWSGWDQFCLQKWSYPYKFGPPRTKNIETNLVRGTIIACKNSPIPTSLLSTRILCELKMFDCIKVLNLLKRLSLVTCYLAKQQKYHSLQYSS